jgi:hypothetical protein
MHGAVLLTNHPVTALARVTSAISIRRRSRRMYPFNPSLDSGATPATTQEDFDQRLAALSQAK